MIMKKEEKIIPLARGIRKLYLWPEGSGSLLTADKLRAGSAEQSALVLHEGTSG